MTGKKTYKTNKILRLRHIFVNHVLIKLLHKCHIKFLQIEPMTLYYFPYFSSFYLKLEKHTCKKKDQDIKTDGSVFLSLRSQ